MNHTGTQVPAESSALSSARPRPSYDEEELRRRYTEAVERLARWLDGMEAERAQHPDSPARRNAQHDPFYWG
jgi:hypothetical protein